MAAVLMVTYPAEAGASFDRDYYVGTHLPLVRDSLGALGLTGATGYFAESDGAVLAVAVLAFTDAAARDAALGSAAAGPVFADIANFTSVQPTPLPLTAA